MLVTTSLSSDLIVPLERRDTSTRDFLNNVLKSGIYDARARVLLKRFAILLDISREELAQQEGEVAMQLADYKSEHEAEVRTDEGNWEIRVSWPRWLPHPPSSWLVDWQIREELAQRQKSQKRNKWMKIGLAGVVVSG